MPRLKALLLIQATYLSSVGAAIATAQQQAWAQEQAPAFQNRIYEALPPDIAQSTQQHTNQVIGASLKLDTMRPFYVIVQQSRRWNPGQVLTIAFNGGSDPLYAQIENAATAWTQAGVANLTFSFKDSSGNYRHWSTSDSGFVADIRIAFASGSSGGYWSVIGTDSRDTTLDGGKPGQASMNFDNFDQRLPSDWAATVLHEFGHALGFEHEHQSPEGGCDFRFNDDPGYVKTTDSDGWYTNDSKGRRPGLYTYLGGKANYWSKATVDANLKSLSAASTQKFLIGPFDKDSIMKYYFDPAMFTSGTKSSCYTGSENTALSPQDITGVHEAYSSDAAAAQAMISDNINTVKALSKVPQISASLRSSLNQRLNIMQRDNLAK
jgi:hypothetical protein